MVREFVTEIVVPRGEACPKPCTRKASCGDVRAFVTSCAVSRAICPRPLYTGCCSPSLTPAAPSARFAFNSGGRHEY